MVDVSRFKGMNIYTNKGKNLGVVENVILDISNSKIDGLYVVSTNPELVENGMNVNVPYRWVQAVGDIVLLKHFPDFVSVKTKPTETSVSPP